MDTLVGSPPNRDINPKSSHVRMGAGLEACAHPALGGGARPSSATPSSPG